jgi:nitrogen regulatory protein PII
MKRIEALLRPDNLCEVTDALLAVGVDDFIVSEVHGSGGQPGKKMYYRGVEYTVDFVSRMRLEVLVSDALSSAVIEAILTTARTGAAGDGMILVHSHADAIPVCAADTTGVEDPISSLPPDEHVDVPEESVLSARGMSAAAIITVLVKLLGLASARWHDLFR